MKKINTNILEAILEAKEEMGVQEFAENLIKLAHDEIIEINFDEGWEYCIDFARCLGDRIKEALDNGEWCFYEIRALFALENVNCEDGDIIEINAYGYPVEILCNTRILYLFGLEDVINEYIENQSVR